MVLTPMLKAYCSFYNVDLSEVKKQDLSDFDTFSEFFIRELKEGARPIANKEDPRSICSPCDGIVYNLGDCSDDTFVVVKGVTYTLDEFLFGKTEESKKYFVKVLEKIKERGNELKFVLLYLSPADYHRYHSSTLCSTNYRRHIPGKMYPVKPSFVEKHPEVFRVNERVVLFGEWINGFFSTTFIGATNVGSIVLHFDKELQTNKKEDRGKQPMDKNYLRMTEMEGIFKNSLIVQKKSMGENEEDVIDITPDLGIFDVKDILDINKGEEKLVYNEKEDAELKYNLKNNFKGAKEGKFDYDEYQANLLEKLENSNKAIQQYALTNKGIMLEKGQEIGYFNMGSSIMLIFETPKGCKFDVEPGQKVALGANLFQST